MRVLLDECLDEALRHLSPGHECQTCRYAGFKGLANGRLLDAAELAGFEVIVTLDRNMSFQQNLHHRSVAMLVLQPRATSHEELAKLMPRLLMALESLKAGDVI